MAVKFFVKTAGAVAVCAAIYAAAGYWGVPQGVRWGAENYLKPLIGADTLSIENVTFNPWTWELSVEGVTALSGKKTPLLTLKRLFVDVSSESLSHSAPVISQLTVDSLKARLTTAKLTSSTASDAASAKSAATAEGSTSGLPAFSISNIAVTDSAVTLSNPAANTVVTVSDITLALPLVSTLATGTMSPMTPEISLKIDGKPIAAKGTATTESADLHLSVANLDAAKLIKAAGLALPVRVEKASVSTDANIHFALKNGTPEVTLNGTVATGPVDVRESNGSPLLTLANAEAKISRFDLAKQSIALASVAVATPNVTLRLMPKTTNKTASASAAASTNSAVAGSAWQWSVANARITNGTVTLSDQTIKPAATLKTTNIQVTAKNLTSAANKTGSVSAAAHLASGTVKTDGTVGINPLKVDLKTDVSSLSLSAFNAWVKALSGAQFSSGTTDVSGKLHYADGKKMSVGFAGSLAVNNLAAKNAKGQNLMTWKKAAATSLNLSSIDPVALTVGELTIEQPAQKATQTVSKIANVFGAIAALTGHEKTAQRAQKVEQEAQRDIHIRNLVYANNQFSINGVGTNTLEALAVNALNNLLAKK